MGWTDDEIEAVRELWAGGLSAGEIAKAIHGKTRCAILGKVHRMGLPPRVGNFRTPPAPTRSFRPRLVVAPPPEPVDALVMEDGSHATVLTVSDAMCRWPIGDPLDENFHFCGHAPKPGYPYCEGHLAKAFTPSTPYQKKMWNLKRI